MKNTLGSVISQLVKKDDLVGGANSWKGDSTGLNHKFSYIDNLKEVDI
jgi:hypothetical protein